MTTAGGHDHSGYYHSIHGNNHRYRGSIHRCHVTLWWMYPPSALAQPVLAIFGAAGAHFAAPWAAHWSGMTCRLYISVDMKS